MGCRCVVSLVGSRHPSDSPLAPDPFMLTEQCRREFREIVLRILDGLELGRTSYALEPWCNTFFYEPGDIHDFFAMVDHPNLRFHLDLMNMVSQPSFHDTTGLVERAFDLLADRVVSVHLKDLRWDFEHLMLKWDEVLIGDGVIDYDAYLSRLAKLPAALLLRAPRERGGIWRELRSAPRSRRARRRTFPAKNSTTDRQRHRMNAREHESDAGWWEGWPWRLIQTNLRQIDMRDVDADRYVESLEWFKATVAMINTSGIIASYPTTLDFHTPSQFLQGDSLAMIIDACHAAGIKVIARADFSKVRRPLYERHPEWAYVRPDGVIVDDDGDVHVCINGAYQQECALRIVEETITTLDVDGIFFNMAGYQTRDYSGTYHGICHCASCGEKFSEMFGLSLPVVEEMDDPVYRKYLLFKERTVRAYKERIDALIRRLRPDLAVDRSFELARGFVRQESNTALDRPLPAWQYSGSDNTKWVVSSFPRMVSSNSSVDFIDFPVRHVAVSPHQQQLRLAQGLANGGALDYYVIGRLDDHADRSGFAGVREIFHYHAAHQADYRDLRSCAAIALLTGPRANTDEFRGWFRILTEHHFLFDTVLLEAATDVVLERYRAAVLPDHQPLGAEVARRLDRFVQRGGTMVATGRVGFRDGEYESRDALALECLGIERVRTVRADMRGSYLEIDERDGFGRLGRPDLVYLDGPYVEADYRTETRRRMRLVPPSPFGPPERCYYETVTKEPGFTVHTHGKGRAVYVPWLCGALFYRHGHPNTSDFAADVLEHHAGLAPLRGYLSPMVEVTLFERANRSYQLLHLVNGSGHFGVSYFAPVPMRDLEVTVPYDGEPSAVISLASDRECRWSWSGGQLTIRVSELRLFEALKIARRADPRSGG